MYLLACVCTTLSWFVVAVASIYSSRVRVFYASGARTTLLVSTKFVAKVASIVSLALWRDAPPSSFCKWYFPVDGAVLLWQAHVAPVGAATQAIIAAADAACTFICCWLLSDRWPYDNISTGTVLAVNLLLASVSLWLADRMEQSERRDFERARAARTACGGAALEGAAADGTAIGVGDATSGKAKRSPWAAAPLPACCGVAACACGCGGRECGGPRVRVWGPTRAGVEAHAGVGADAEVDGGCDGKETGTDLLSQALSAGEEASAVTPASQQQLQPLRDGTRSLDECCCLDRIQMTCIGGPGASSSGVLPGATGAGVGVGRCCSSGSAGGSSSSSACGCGVNVGGAGGTTCSEALSPGTLSTTRSLSRALPSFSTLSNCSILGGGGGGAGGSIFAGGLADTCGSSRDASRPSSCLGALLTSRTAGQQPQPPAAAGRALTAVTGHTGSAAGRAQFGAGADAAMVGGPLASSAVAVDAAADAVTSAPAAGMPPPPLGAVGQPPSPSPPPPSFGKRILARGASGGLAPSLASRSTEMASPGTISKLDGSGRVRIPEVLAACGEEEHSVGGSDAVPAAAAAPPPPPPVGPSQGAGRLLQDRRMAQHLVTRNDGAAGAVATAAAVVTPATVTPAEPGVKKTRSRGTSTSGAGSTSSGPGSTSIAGSYCSSSSRTSEPRLCSYQWQEGTAAPPQLGRGAAAALCSRRSVNPQLRSAAVPTAAAEASQQRAQCSKPNEGGAAAGARAVGAPAADAQDACGCSPVITAGGHLLVSADGVLAHPQPPLNLEGPLPQSRREHQQPPEQQRRRQQPRAIACPALSADTVSPAQQQAPQEREGHVAQPVAVAAAAAREKCAPLAASSAEPVGGAASAAAGAIVVGGKTTLVQLGTVAAAAPADAAPPAATAVQQMVAAAAAPGAAPYVTGEYSAAAGARLSPFSTSHAAAAPDAELRTPRCFAMARALVSRGGCHAMYDTPALHHTRCSVKLGGLTPADLPYGFVERVASLLAAAGGSAAAAAAGHPAAATAALAAVGVYVREGCVEVVADVLVPTDATAAEALVVGLAANAAANTRGGDGRADGGGAAGIAALERMLVVAEEAAAGVTPATPPTPPTPPTATATGLHPERASAEAMLDLLERSLLPQITDAVSASRPSAQGGVALPPVPINAVGMQTTVGGVQVMAWRTPQLPAALAPPPPPPPPTIVCVTPCCVTLNSANLDDTRDRRRQTVTLTVALAGFGVSVDVAQPPRVFVRHSGRCLAAVVRACPERYAGCLALTVELAMSGVRPGLLFLEVAAAADNDGGGGAAALSLPWPVLVTADPRVAVEVMQLQQQLEAAAPLRAMQAEMELLQYRQRVGGDPHLQQKQQQFPPLWQLDGGTTSLLLDFGAWFEAVSVADAAVITAATGRPAFGQPAAAAAAVAAAAQRAAPAVVPCAAAPELSPLPLPLTPPVTASATEEDDGSNEEARQDVGDEQEGEPELQQRGSRGGSSWESSSEEEEEEDREVSADRASTAVGWMPRHTARRLRRALGSPIARGGGGGAAAAAAASGSGSCDAAAADGGSDTAEVQMLLLRSLQPDQELLEGSLDCAAEYEQTCRQGPVLQSSAAGLGLRLLRFTVTRGWPAAATLLLRGLMVHCRLGFREVRLLFAAAVSGGGADGMPLLHTAVMSGSLAMVRAVKAWAQRYREPLPWDEPVAAAGGLTPLHLAAVQDNGRLAGAILGLWPDAEAHWAVARDHDGRTPQEYACMRAMSGSGASSGAAPRSAAAAAAAATFPARSLEAALPGQQQPRAARPQLLQPQQQSQRSAGLVEGTAAAAAPIPGRPHFVLAPQAPRPPRSQSLSPPPLPEALGADGAATVATAAAAPHRGDGPGSGTSSVFMTSMAPGVPCPGSVFGRFDRTSDCGSLSMGPDSQWSHSTNATAQTHYNHQDLRASGLSPVNFVGVQHALNAALLSLANLPDGGSSSHSSGAGAVASAGAAAAGTSGGGAGGAADACGGGALSLSGINKNSDNGSGICEPSSPQRQLLALATHPLQQQQHLQHLQHLLHLQQQLRQQPSESGRGMRAPFQLDRSHGHKTALSPLSPQLHQVLQQQQQQHRKQPHPCPPSLAGYAPPSSGAGNDGLPAGHTLPLGPEPPLPPPPPPREQQLLLASEYHNPQSPASESQCQQQQQPGRIALQAGGHGHGGVAPRAAAAGAAAAAAPGGAAGCSAAAAGPGPGPYSPSAAAETSALAPSRLSHTSCVTSSGAGAGASTSIPAVIPAGPKQLDWQGQVGVSLCAADAGAQPAPAPVPDSSRTSASGVPTAATAASAAGTAGDAAAVPPPSAQPPRTAAAPQAAATKPPPPPMPQQHVASGAATAAAAVSSRVSSRGVRLLATSLLVNGGAADGSPPRTAFPAGSIGSPSSSAAAATTSYSTRSTLASAASTQSLLNTASRRRGSADGRFSANTRRAAFADDYAPACQPTLAARTSRLAGVLPLLAAAWRVAGGDADRVAAARAQLLAAGRAGATAAAAVGADADADASAALAAASTAESRRPGPGAALPDGVGRVNSGGVGGERSEAAPLARTGPAPDGKGLLRLESAFAPAATGSAAVDIQEVRPPAEIRQAAAGDVPPRLPSPEAQVRASVRGPPADETAVGSASAAAAAAWPDAARKVPRLHLQQLGLLLAGLVLMAAVLLPAVTRRMGAKLVGQP